MNKIAKILSAVLSVTLVIGVTVAMLVSAFAASAPKFSVNVVSESKDEVKVAFSLVDGSFSALDLLLNSSDWNKESKTTGLTLASIEKAQAYKDFYTAHENDDAPPMMATNYKTGKVSYTSIAPYDAKGQMLIFTFKKTSSAKEKIVASDIVATVTSCTGADNKEVTASVTNNIPAEVVTTNPTTTTTTKKADVIIPTTEITTTTTEKADVTTTTEKADVTTTTEKADVTTTTEKADVTTTTEKADVTTTTEKVDDVTTTTAKVDGVTTVTDKADDTTKSDDVVTTAPAADTTTAASSSDVVNPETGDRLTATAAVVSLLAISGAAVVALRKKED